MIDLLAEGLVTWENRWHVAEDLADAWLVHAATGDSEIDSRVCAWASLLRATA